MTRHVAWESKNPSNDDLKMAVSAVTISAVAIVRSHKKVSSRAQAQPEVEGPAVYTGSSTLINQAPFSSSPSMPMKEKGARTD